MIVFNTIIRDKTVLISIHLVSVCENCDINDKKLKTVVTLRIAIRLKKLNELTKQNYETTKDVLSAQDSKLE